MKTEKEIQRAEERRTRPRLLWVKVPPEHAKRLSDTAEKIGISRADYMRLILINHVNNDSQSFTINTQTK
jgi:predicted DNA-binding protein